MPDSKLWEHKPWERRGFDLLLEHCPTATVTLIERKPPWTVVVLDGAEHADYAIWRSTGAVYRMGLDPDLPGAVEDDPFLVPVGSPFLDPHERSIE